MKSTPEKWKLSAMKPNAFNEPCYQDPNHPKAPNKRNIPEAIGYQKPEDMLPQAKSEEPKGA